VSAHSPVHGEHGGAELIGQAHGAEREERGVRGNGSVTGDPGTRDRERERVSGRRKLAPTGWLH
jgi:anti-sigma factor ChrR (cupin superfamily)